MKRSRVVSAAVALAALMGGGVAWAGAASAHAGADLSQHGTPRAQELTFVEHAITDTIVHLSGPGDHRGDQLAFSNPVYNAQNRVKVGYDLGDCVRTNPGVSWECHWTLELAQGSLVVEGPFFDTADSTLAIIGGTGRYIKARGEMGLHALNGAGTAYRFTYRITG